MKKIIALLLCAVMLLPVMTGCGNKHKHCICGGVLEGHECQKAEWIPLTQANFAEVTNESAPVSLHNESVYKLAAGNYYLAENIAVSEQILIFEEVNLCLNGLRLAGTHSERTGKFSRIFAVSGGTLNICDCQAQTGQGNIQGSYANNAGTILVQGTGGGAEGTLGNLNLYSGIIKGGRAQSTHGGTIGITGGTFRMYGGTVTGGAANLKGGTIYLAAEQTFIGLGGTVETGAASSGQCVFVSAGATVSLGGTANVAEVYLEDGANFGIKQEVPPAEGFGTNISMQTPGVFAKSVPQDYSGYFGGFVTYDPVEKTLSLG